MDELKGRAAIITGANRGLGLAIAEAYVVAGADVFLCGRDASALASARESLVERAGAGQQVLAQAVDVSDERQVKTFVAQAVEALPSVCILVNNAGVYGPKGPIESVSSAEWVRSIEINLYGS